MNAKYLSEINNCEVFDISSPRFKTFGNIITQLDFSPFEQYMATTAIPQDGNAYVPSIPEMESLEITSTIQNEVYGGLEIQVGYCNGRNSTYNGFEYHKCSEITYAITDFMLVLGHTWDMDGCTYPSKDATVFFVPKGTAFEIFQTTLHLSPCKVSDDGYKAVIILAKGTNTTAFVKTTPQTTEGEMLLYKNKWIICHKDREPLVKQGAKIGLVGENIQLKY